MKKKYNKILFGLLFLGTNLVSMPGKQKNDFKRINADAQEEGENEKGQPSVQPQEEMVEPSAASNTNVGEVSNSMLPSSKPVTVEGELVDHSAAETTNVPGVDRTMLPSKAQAALGASAPTDEAAEQAAAEQAAAEQAAAEQAAAKQAAAEQAAAEQAVAASNKEKQKEEKDEKQDPPSNSNNPKGNPLKESPFELKKYDFLKNGLGVVLGASYSFNESCDGFAHANIAFESANMVVGGSYAINEIVSVGFGALLSGRRGDSSKLFKTENGSEQTQDISSLFLLGVGGIVSYSFENNLKIIGMIGYSWFMSEDLKEKDYSGSLIVSISIVYDCLVNDQFSVNIGGFAGYNKDCKSSSEKDENSKN